jgi:hypothetical protein
MIKRFLLFRKVELGLGFLGITALAAALSSCAVLPQGAAAAPGDWQEEFNLASRGLTHTGVSKFFILKPGYQITLASGNTKLIIAVLNETKVINGVTTRVVEEREEKNGRLYEVARNFYAMDPETGDTFYFGEEVDFYKDGRVTGHAGAWIAYEGGNKPGLIMPGTPRVGIKYYQELAPGVAMDRAEVMRVSETFKTPAGEFKDCLVTRESSKIESAVEQKTFAPGIGLIQDQAMKLVSYGYVKTKP